MKYIIGVHEVVGNRIEVMLQRKSFGVDNISSVCCSHMVVDVTV